MTAGRLWGSLLLLVAWIGCGGALPVEGAAAPASLVLVRNRQPRATIVLGEKPTASAQLAAYELQYHLRKMSVATLPIVREPQSVTGTVVLVGESNATRALGYRSEDFEVSEYLMEATDGRLVLIGRDHERRVEVDYDGDLREMILQMSPDPLGTCFAVHTLLERCLGVRWYLPTELGEVIPKRATVAVKAMKVRRRVDVPYRTPYVPWAVNKQLYYNDYQTVDWRKSEHWDLRSGVLYWIRNKQWGGPVVWANHSFAGWDQAFGKEHPDWFNTKSWERMQQVSYQAGVQPCLSNPGLFQANLDLIRGFLDGKPSPFPQAYYSALRHDGGLFSMGLNDGGAYCYCKECVALGQYRSDPAYGIGVASTYWWSYVNRLAHEVGRTHPRAKLVGLAYMGYTAPPEGIKFEPNVGVVYCRFPHRYWREDYKRRDYEEIRKYLEECGAQAFFTWDYVLHPPASSNPFPAIIPRLVAEDAKHMTSLPAFKGGFMEITYNKVRKDGAYEWADNVWSSPVLDHFRVHFRLKVWDDQTLDVGTLLDEYFTKFYGPAAPQVRRFVEALESRWRDPELRKEGGAFPPMGPCHYGDDTTHFWWERMGTPEFIRQLQELMKAARRKAPAGTLYAQRVDLLDRGVLQLIANNRGKYVHSEMAKLPPVPELSVLIGSAPALDGRGDDPVWQAVPWQGITRTNENRAAAVGARFKAVADREGLYLLVECAEPLTGSLVAHTEGGGPAVLSDDSLEIFLDKDPTDGKYYHLGYNTRGAVYESSVHPAGAATDAAAWKSGSRCRTSISDQRNWTAEIAIPWQNVSGGPVRPGQSWRLNVCRNRLTTKGAIEYTNWSVCGGGFHTPARFGRLTFK